MIKSPKLRRIYTYVVPHFIRGRLEVWIAGRYPKIFDEKKFVFIHIPKTAGKSIGKLIGLRGACHLTMAEYEEIIGRERLKEYFLFSVVRDPAEKIVSAWNYIMTGGNQSKEDIELRGELLSVSSNLEDFITDQLGRNRYLNHRLFKSQKDYLSFSDGHIPENLYLIHINHLSEGLEALPERVLRACVKLPHENRSRTAVPGLSANARQILVEVYRQDYEMIERLQSESKFL
ncbi:sulfotransferase family protein [Marinobacter pelagius]|uniref:sulfotransferase family 2 domain-containing protein n=1 Tax=Marinobacter sp. C7 TaxID=2951363 RepID=UPI001EEF9BB8|nr:sulfotransferase family 2 domain-containing protein [Marinobacter sp. C7]MCG7199104.1 sulfotransferase family protein [Marinobacter sp. C7]